MARKQNSFSKRFPYFGIFFLIAVAIAIPLTVWSLKNVSTNTEQHASGCAIAPSWTLVGHTDYATSVKYQFTLKNNCSSTTLFSLSATKPTGWNYQYAGCNVNTVCSKGMSALSSSTVYVTISRPISASTGTYYITLRAGVSDNGGVYTLKTISYIVTNVSCNSGLVCSSCKANAGSCGSGTKTCKYTNYNGSTACTQVTAPSQSCTVGCSTGSTCTNNQCITSSYTCTQNGGTCFNSSSSCATMGLVGVSGSCASGQVCCSKPTCGSSNTTGTCPTGQTCQYDSTTSVYSCKSTYTCSNSNPTGTCPTGQTCSYSSTMSGYTCQNGCSSTYPNGYCPKGYTCQYDSTGGSYVCK